MSSGKKLTRFKVCLGSSCYSRANQEYVRIIKDFVAQNYLIDQVEISGSHCLNKCHCGPHVLIDDKEYSNISKEMLKQVLRETLLPRKSS